MSLKLRLPISTSLGQLRRQRRPRAEQGVALIVTLFIVALLTILVLEYHFDAVIELDMASNYASDIRAHHLALAGVQFAQALLQRDDDPKSDGPEDIWYLFGVLPSCVPPQQLLEFAASLGPASEPTRASQSALATEDKRSDQEAQSETGCVSLKIIDESGKLPLNALEPPSLGSSPGGTTGGTSGGTTGGSTRGSQGGPTGGTAGGASAQAKAMHTGWKNIFKKFFENRGINAEVVGALIDWIDPDDNEEPDGGAEESYYNGLATPYKPHNSQIRMAGELRLIKGFHTENLARLLADNPLSDNTLSDSALQAVADADLGKNPYLTPYGARSRNASTNTSPKVNLNTAPEEVLKALFEGVGLDSNTCVNEITTNRQQKQMKALSELPAACRGGQPQLTNFVGTNSTYFRVEVTARLGVIEKHAVAVVNRTQSTNNNQRPSMAYFKLE